jgi:hypothetical protein
MIIVIQVHSELGLADKNSPESRINELLLGKPLKGTEKSDMLSSAQVSQILNNTQNKMDQEEAKSLTDHLEALLLHGQRDEALNLAIQKEHFAFALLIGSVCGKDQFQYAARCYADKCLQSSASLHFMSMIFSNQASNVIRHGGKRLIDNASSTIGNANQISSFVQDWKKNLACILANKSSDWVELVRSLGERIATENLVLVHESF